MPTDKVCVARRYITFDLNRNDSGVLFLKLGLCLKGTVQLGVNIRVYLCGICPLFCWAV